MNERLSQNKESEGKNNLIKANAFFDATRYINLMKKKSPESLNMDSEGNIVLNMIEGEKIMEETRTKLDLNRDEFVTYLFALENRVKEILQH